MGLQLGVELSRACGSSSRITTRVSVGKHDGGLARLVDAGGSRSARATISVNEPAASSLKVSTMLRHMDAAGDRTIQTKWSLFAQLRRGTGGKSRVPH